MSAILDLFVRSPLLTLFFCVGIGLLLGRVKLLGISLGAAGALFAALGLSAAVYLAQLPNPGNQFDASGHLLAHATIALPAFFNSFALAVFCYMVGISAGPSIVDALRTGWQPVVVALVAAFATAAAAIGFGRLLGLNIGEVGGVYAGAGTATAALGVVQAQLLGSGASNATELANGAAVGYGIGYPVGVIVSILFLIALIRIGQRQPVGEDREPVPPMEVRTILITKPGANATVGGLAAAHDFVVSRITRDGKTVVARPEAEVLPGDLLVVTGRGDHLATAVGALGEFSATEHWYDRTDIDFRRVMLSRPALATARVADLPILEKFGAVVSRVRRGDQDLLARPDLRLQLGDRLRITAPRQQMSAVSDFLGDSERSAGDINPIGLGLGLTIGLLVAFISIPLPGGAALVIGTASGPLIVGTVLGAIGRTGPVVWQLPPGVANSLNQFSLLLFLVGVGTGAGEHLVSAIEDGGWVKVLIANVLVAAVHAVLVLGALRWLLHFGVARTLGAFTGSQLCPGVYGYALGRIPDQRVAMGYAVLFPVMMVAKVIIDQLIVVFF